MKRSGYRTIFHIYLIFFLALLGTVLLAGYFFLPDGFCSDTGWHEYQK